MSKISCLLTTCFFVVVFFTFGCVDEKEGISREGLELAKQKCSTCHVFPSADLLPKHAWSEYVLPKMSPYFGLTHLGFNRYFESDSTVSSLRLSEWSKILFYYLNESLSDSAAQVANTRIGIDSNSFTTELPVLHEGVPATTFVDFTSEDSSIVFADGVARMLYRLNCKGAVADSVHVQTGVSDVKKISNKYFVLSMGVMYPSDQQLGSLSIQSFGSAAPLKVLDSLQRPVNFEVVDLNSDGRDDIIICQFGNNVGKLSWYELLADGSYKENLLRALPGAVRVQIADLNKDQLPDIVALMAQGDEGVYAYMNRGNGRFIETRLLRFSPSHGSNYFELVDYNGDGHLDILATNGDNGDYPPVLKSYHGVRIYLNNKQNQFRLSLFLPLNGASGARVVDFDKDGDPDIAAISYFPDLQNNPAESFILFRNKGKDNFEYTTIPDAAIGRWLTMDAADIDSDGDTDIVLGCAPFSLGLVPAEVRAKWNKGSPAVVILRNNLYKPRS